MLGLRAYLVAGSRNVNSKLIVVVVSERVYKLGFNIVASGDRAKSLFSTGGRTCCRGNDCPITHRVTGCRNGSVGVGVIAGITGV